VYGLLERSLSQIPSDLSQEPMAILNWSRWHRSSTNEPVSMEPAQKLLPSTSTQKKVAIHPIVNVAARG
jgi:hypothetical protein